MSNFIKCNYSLAQDQYEKLSLGAIGLWHFLINQRRNWDLTPESISNRNADDLDTVRKLLRELADKNMLEITKSANGEIIYKLKSGVSMTTAKRLAMGEAGAGGRPCREKYTSDEEYEEAFYSWNTMK